MTQIQQVVTLSKNILQPGDNDLRASTQKMLASLALNNSTQLILAFTNILKSISITNIGDESDEVKTFAATQLKKHLTAFDQAKYANIWGKMPA